MVVIYYLLYCYNPELIFCQLLIPQHSYNIHNEKDAFKKHSGQLNLKYRFKMSEYSQRPVINIKNSGNKMVQRDYNKTAQVKN